VDAEVYLSYVSGEMLMRCSWDAHELRKHSDTRSNCCFTERWRLVQKREWSMNSSEGIHQMSAKFIMYPIHNAPSAS